jgi:hypothetical protein
MTMIKPQLEREAVYILCISLILVFTRAIMAVPLIELIEEIGVAFLTWYGLILGTWIERKLFGQNISPH